MNEKRPYCQSVCMLAKESGHSGSGEILKGIQQGGGMFLHLFLQCFEHITCQARFSALGIYQ